MHLQYLRYVVRHKWFVFLECCRLGIPLLGIVHDLSKFLPSEWFPYARYFYGPNGRNHTPSEKCDFDVAWLHHQHRNKHHWQRWVVWEDDGPMYPLPMPDKYRRELLADWKGAGQAVGKPDTKGWYLKQKSRGWQGLHPETRQWIEAMLDVIDTRRN